jgi:quercetin dioxygenase-like cupin family protein
MKGHMTSACQTRRRFASGFACAVFLLSVAGMGWSQEGRPGGERSRGGVRGCPPVSERKVELGCYTLAVSKLGELPDAPLYWNLDAYPTRAAAEAARGPRGTVVESLGKVWLLTIGKAGEKAAGGDHVASIGPLPVTPGGAYTAAYMEAIMMPGARTPAHRHPGPEAWFQASGEVCLETPAGKSVGRVGGDAVIVPGGTPMALTVTGVEQRRSIVLVLHDSSRPWTILAPDWKPKGLCGR